MRGFQALPSQAMINSGPAACRYWPNYQKPSQTTPERKDYLPKRLFFLHLNPLSCPKNVNILLSNKISQPFDSINVCQMHSASLNVLDLYKKTILQQQRLSTDLPQPNPDVFNSNFLLRKYILHIPFRGSTQKSSSRSLLIKHPTKLRWKVGPWLLFKRNRALN